MEILMDKLFCFVGVRDYIHVMDLASGHVAALNKLKKEHLRLKVGKLAGIKVKVKSVCGSFSTYA
jgi:UDP-glucose 4-epimerase